MIPEGNPKGVGPDPVGLRGQAPRRAPGTVPGFWLYPYRTGILPHTDPTARGFPGFWPRRGNCGATPPRDNTNATLPPARSGKGQGVLAGFWLRRGEIAVPPRQETAPTQLCHQPRRTIEARPVHALYAKVQGRGRTPATLSKKIVKSAKYAKVQGRGRKDPGDFIEKKS